jgi:hypothetical protein
MLRAPVILIALAALGCAGHPASSDEPAAGLRVLFVGNSLTEGNGLTAMVRGLAHAAGARLEVAEVTIGGLSLEDHWNLGAARAAIARGGWREVVLQQGPSSLPDSRANLLVWSARFAEDIRRVGARPALYSVWPDASRLAFFDDVTESYRQAAEHVDGALFPAGEAWRAAWKRAPGLELYGPDGFHPTARGSYLAALVITAQLLQRSPRGLARDLPSGTAAPGVHLDAGERAVLEAAAGEAIASHARR